MTEDADLEVAIQRTAVAAHKFVNGDPEGFTAIWSRGEDVTIFGGYGSGERGREEVASRLAWASARFASGEISYEPITSGSSGDLAYAIGIERGRVSIAGRGMTDDLALRVTHLFRREDGDWKLIHRHADPIMTVTAPEALVRQPVAAPADGRSR